MLWSHLPDHLEHFDLKIADYRYSYSYRFKPAVHDWVGINRTWRHGTWRWSNGTTVHDGKWESDGESTKRGNCAIYHWMRVDKSSTYKLVWRNRECSEPTYYACDHQGESIYFHLMLFDCF